MTRIDDDERWIERDEVVLLFDPKAERVHLVTRREVRARRFV